MASAGALSGLQPARHRDSPGTRSVVSPGHNRICAHCQTALPELRVVESRSLLRMNGARSGKESEGECALAVLCTQATNSNLNGANERPGPRPLPRQVVTLAFLSEHLPAGLISERLARSLC